jgi:hypothetical protein
MVGYDNLIFGEAVAGYGLDGVVWKDFMMRNEGA